MSRPSETSAVAVVVPAYNEASVLGRVLDELGQRPYTIIVVDDGSTDDTSQVAATRNVTLLRHPINLGQGAALQTGIAYALACTEAPFLVTFDSDGQHTAEDIDRLLEPLRANTMDVALGSRFLEAGGTENLPLSKRMALKLGVWFTRVMTGLQVTDAHNGLRALTRSAASQFDLRQNRMAHASEILSVIAQRKLRYVEVPVRIRYTEYSLRKGQTALHSLNILWELLTARVR